MNKEEFWKNYPEFQGELVADEVIRLSKKYIGEKVLDVGAGSGALIKKIPNSVGIDIVERKGIPYFEPFIQKANITKLPFKDNKFDTIFATELLEHLTDEELEKGLKEVYRVLKPNGYFIVTVPNKENLEERMVTCPYCNKRFHRVLHLRSFDNDSLIDVLNDFELIKISQEPYDFNKIVKYKYIRFLKPLLNLFKKGSLFVVEQKKWAKKK